ncbi:MAG: hypothetical protein H7230_01805 [Candidatus Parcubacteria bacterium]|nr:hypothetical protein [Candidatus Paceibacterota bacterium]
MTVIITLPSIISPDLLDKLQAKIVTELNLDNQVSFVVRYDVSLILGYSLTIGSQIYDKSFAAAIKSKLAIIQAKIQ